MDSPSGRQGFAHGSMAMGPAGGMAYGEEDYENEPPLLEELGINFEHIMTKTAAVLVPLRPVPDTILDDAGEREMRLSSANAKPKIQFVV